ncbi:transmembrane protein 272-like isoform X1 [Kryptolebias marmoratus]|uniref:transmembrane protein 272-like isoform X1 n=1 Tax=Kryptolebias marmoratus TaxID=37003 RepID=UPI0018ACB741|nr:transmembrane protein 272-like isoform X1 [Kryptolebias marmoratus]XP_037832279.1 transmembrane protein 272-like isoform X1 [Kryptolebias marmoratus]
MAAPSPGHPVTVTIGTVWKVRLEPPPPEPPRMSVGGLISWIVLNVARVIFGVVYLKECPQQPNIPNFLLGLVLVAMLMVSFMTFPCESQAAARPREHPSGCKDCVKCLLGLSVFIWILLGDVWVFSVYQPNYDPTAADGLYCNKTLYTFAFWNAVFETFVMGVLLAKFFKGLLCFVTLSPAPQDADFYRNV